MKKCQLTLKLMTAVFAIGFATVGCNMELNKEKKDKNHEAPVPPQRAPENR